MPTEADRKKLAHAIKDNAPKIHELLQRDYAKELLLMKDEGGVLPIHDACRWKLDSGSVELILDFAVEHGIIKEMLEAKNNDDWSCIHIACVNDLSFDSFFLLLEYSTQYADIKKILEQKTNCGLTCLHYACDDKLSTDSLSLLFQYLSKHADIKMMLEGKDNGNLSCLHHACREKLSANSLSVCCLRTWSNSPTPRRRLRSRTFTLQNCLHLAWRHRLPFDSLRLLLEYLSKHADVKKMLEEKGENDCTCLHEAFRLKLSSIDSCRLLISFFPSKEMFENALAVKNQKGDTPLDNVKNDEVKQLVQDPDCWKKCRLWLLQNHEETFFAAFYRNSLDKICKALKELSENDLQHSQQHSTMMLIALMPSPSKFREAVGKTDSSAPMSKYFDDVKKGDKKSDYNHWRKNIHLFRDFYAQLPPSERKTASTFEGEDSSSCSIQ